MRKSDRNDENVYGYLLMLRRMNETARNAKHQQRDQYCWERKLHVGYAHDYRIDTPAQEASNETKGDAHRH